MSNELLWQPIPEEKFACKALPGRGSVLQAKNLGAE